MSMTLFELAEMVGGQLVGDGHLHIAGAATLNEVREGEITFAESPILEPRLKQSNAAAVVVPTTYQPTGIAYIVVDDVRRAFGRIVAYFRPPRKAVPVGISPAAHISPSAILGENVEIHPGASIGDGVRIGQGSVIHSGACIMAGSQLAENVTVFPCAVLYENTVIGPRTVIHAGAVLGSYGFGYQTADGRHVQCAQLGHVQIGADVEIGAATTIDRGTFGPTRIGDGTKIDNQVMIGHNCQIGKHNLLCSQVGIAGSVTTGDYVVMAGQVGIRDHVKIADGVVLGARSGVGSDITAAGRYFGAPARPDREQLQILMAQQKIPAMRKQLKALEETVEQLGRTIRRQSSPPQAA